MFAHSVQALFLSEGVSALGAEETQDNVVEAKAEEYRKHREYREAK